MNRVWSVVLAVVSTTGPLHAQFAPSARASGLAGAGLVFAAGAEAAVTNPANLAWEIGWSVAPLSVGIAGGVTGSSLSDFGDIVTARGRGLPGLVTALPTKGLHLQGSGDGLTFALGARASGMPQPGSPFPSVSLSYGNLGFGIRSLASTELTLSRGLVDLMANGFDPARLASYAMGESGFRALSYTEITGAYGRSIGPRWAVGASVRLVRGGTLVEGRLSEPEFDLSGPSMGIRGVSVESVGGLGVGLDLAATARVTPDVRISVVLGNVLQRVTWNDALVSNVGLLADTDFSEYDLAGLLGRFDGRAVDPRAVDLSVYQASRSLFEGSFLPTVLRAGAGWRRGDTSVEVVAAKPSRGRLTDLWEERVSLGFAQILGPATFRAGAARAGGGTRVFSVGFGVAHGRARLDLAGGVLSGRMVGADRSGGHLSLGVTVRSGGG